MNRRENLVAIMELVKDNAEYVAFLENEIAKVDNRNAKAKEKRAEKVGEAGEVIREDAINVLRETGRPITLAELVANFKAERDFWLASECHILCNTDTLTVLQYNDRDFNKIKIFTFAKFPVQNYVTVYPKTEGDGVYKDQLGEEYTAALLDAEGIEVCIKKSFAANSVMLVKK